jgi:hypothetical protein
MERTQNQNIRLRWLSCLFEFGHIEYQKKLWFAKYPKLVGDYGETLCHYFDSLDLADGYKDFLLEKIISEKEFKIIEDFHNDLRDYTERPEKRNLSDKKILRDPEWINLTLVAKQNWEELKKLISDNVELEKISEWEKSI